MAKVTINKNGIGNKYKFTVTKNGNFIPSDIMSFRKGTTDSSLLNPHIFVSPNSILFTDDPSSETVDVSANADWNVINYTNNPEWIELSNTSGNGNTSISVDVSVNEDTSIRSFTYEFKLNNYDASTNLIIEQEAAPARIDPGLLQLTNYTANSTDYIKFDANLRNSSDTSAVSSYTHTYLKQWDGTEWVRYDPNTSPYYIERQHDISAGGITDLITFYDTQNRGQLPNGDYRLYVVGGPDDYYWAMNEFTVDSGGGSSSQSGDYDVIKDGPPESP